MGNATNTAEQEKVEKEKASKAAAVKLTNERTEKAEKSVTVFWHEARMLTWAGHTYRTDKDDKGNAIRVTTQGSDGKGYDPAEVDRKRGYEGHGSVIKFVPGENVIPLLAWEDMIEHETIKDYLENGQLEVFDPAIQKGKQAPSTPGLADDLEAYSYKDSIKLIGETMSIEKLTKWRTNLDPKREKAQQIKEAITTQISKITAAG